MKPIRSLLLFASLVLVLALLWPCSAAAQEATEGINSGNYNIRQTIEFGYRFIPDDDFTNCPVGTTGCVAHSRPIYNTFVDLTRGFRLFEHSLLMRSLNHQGLLFDSLSVTSFGYGGDPNDVTRLRMYKNKWYNFGATFRRDRNFWDYNLLANPLNPTALTPAVAATAPPGFSPVVANSPHQFEVTRKFSDFNLTVLPQSRIRFRLGYSFNVNEGPSFSSLHEGTDVPLFQNWKTTTHSYQVGVDFKYLPKTNISYDKFFNYYKGDTSWVDNNQTFQLPNLTPVDIGLPFNTPAGQPCAAPFNAVPLGTVNPACNGYVVYTRSGPVRTSIPTDQLIVQTSYFKNLDFSGRFVYSTAGGKRRGDVLDFSEFFQGLVTRTRQRQFDISGPARYKRDSASVDIGATYHVTDKLRFIYLFRFQNFRIPGLWDSAEQSLFGTSMVVAPNIFTPGAAPPANCNTLASPPVTTGCPLHNSSSPADILSQTFHASLRQDLKNHLFEVQYDFSKRLGARVGYRYRHRTIIHAGAQAEEDSFIFFPGGPVPTPPAGFPPFPWTQFGLPATGTLAVRGACAWVFNSTTNSWFLPSGCVDPVTGLARLQPDGSLLGTFSEEEEGDVTEINEHSALFGIWTRPIDALRISFDLELMSADNSFTRISPRQLQHYKVRGSYKPVHWASFGMTLNILENRNNVFQVNNKQHNRAYGFSAALEPNEKWSLDFGYDYNDIFSTTLICYPISQPTPPVLSPCVDATLTPISGLFLNTSFYTNKAHYAYFDLTWQPMKRFRTLIGYQLTSTAGDSLIITGPQNITGVVPNPPRGTLAFNYHKPYAGFVVEMYKGLSWRAQWNYYGYNEKSDPGLGFGFFPRDFRGNMVTLAIRYGF